MQANFSLPHTFAGAKLLLFFDICKKNREKMFFDHIFFAALQPFIHKKNERLATTVPGVKPLLYLKNL